MRLQDHLVKQTQRALNDVLRAIEALPEDKRDWKPCDSARSALSQLKEVASAPGFFIHVLEHGAPPPFEDHAKDQSQEKTQAQPAGQSSYETARESAMKGTAALCAVIMEFPDDRLNAEVVLPFHGGVVMTMAEVLGLHMWNLTYHYGQINYIQTLLGDREMH